MDNTDKDVMLWVRNHPEEAQKIVDQTLISKIGQTVIADQSEIVSRAIKKLDVLEEFETLRPYIKKRLKRRKQPILFDSPVTEQQEILTIDNFLDCEWSDLFDRFENPKNPINKIIKSARKEYEKLSDHQTIDSSILNEKYFPAYHGHAVDVLALFSSRDIDGYVPDGRAVINTQDNYDTQIFLPGGSQYGVNTHKLLMVAVGEFTKQNHYSRSTKQRTLNRQVSIPFDEFARKRNYKIDILPDMTEEEKKRAGYRKKKAKKEISEDCDALVSMFIKFRDKPKRKGEATDFTNLSPVEVAEIRKGYINIVFTPTMATYLSRLPEMQYPPALLSVNAKNPNAYAIGYKMASHYNLDANIIKGTNSRLKVDTLLSNTALPTLEDLASINHARHWEDRIKEPFERALDQLTGVLISDWKYVKAKGVELTDQEAGQIDSYDTFTNLYIEFSLIGDPKGQDERRERRAIEKKEAEDNKDMKKVTREIKKLRSEIKNQNRKK